ncbi:uncharacterized protein [Magallana gigas]|uniref:uncharacterized protein isoform X3 n=1 Tax=Magallana gigas TaxID=29159 RepID=UPI0005C3AB75|eukprot:XP_011414782.1 PREDICTED: uncharacterized protein LOC105319075 isoform X2 [Crassostrea gigas]
MSQHEESTSASDSEISKTSSPSSSDVEQFPKCTSDWDCHFVDKLCVSYKQEDIIRIISSEWSLFHLYEEDRLEVERCLNACDLKLNYESLEDLPPDVTTPIEKFARGWEPNQLQLRVMQAEPLLKKFLFKLDEFNYCLAQIVSENKPNTKISEWKYQCLFEKLLHLFGIYTWTQPFISTKKSQIMGRTVSSKADILCCRTDPALQRPILCICEVKKNLSDEICQLSPPRKKLRNASYQDTANTYIGEHSLWSQHIGELFVYLDKSARNEGILGITVEKTWVRVTFLKVNEPCLEKIRNMPVNRPGSVKLNDDEHPVFFYSERYNYLKQKDRKTLFKALLLIRMMQDRFEAGRGASRF